MTYEDKTWTCLSPFNSVVEKDVLSGSPVVRTWHFHCWDLGSILGRGNKIPAAPWAKNKNKRTTKCALISDCELMVLISSGQHYYISHSFAQKCSLEICF